MKITIIKTVATIITAITLIAALSVVCFATYYSNQHWYVLSKRNTNGSSEYLSEQKKEYNPVSVNTGDKSSVTVSLWEDLFLGFDQLCPNNQVLDYGNNRRAWWYGNGEGNYFLYAEASTSDICLSGYLRNYSIN